MRRKNERMTDDADRVVKGNYILDYALGSVTNAKIKSQNSPISFS